MVQKLFQESQAKMSLGNPIKVIESSAKGKYTLRSSKGDMTFDHVVIAAPLEFTDIKLVNFSLPSFRKGNTFTGTSHSLLPKV